ncbi:MAG: hypothetical protein KC549_17795 [Myxococcales bacterium]|nr:hypothetical protein [Myxococcales bacterium]MCB9549257.1 hypothetical protein [Myxococcales bacterium]
MRAEVLGVLLLCACGSSRAEPEKPDPAVARAQAEAAKRRIERLEQELVEARARLNQTGPPPGPPAPRPPGLKPGDGLRLELGTARYVERPGEPARNRSLAEHVGQGRGAVLALWATWCKPCIADDELVLLRDLQARLPPDFPLVSMACDGLDDVRTHAKAGRFVHPVWQIDDGHLAVLPQAFIQQHGLGLPLFLVVGADGTLKAWRNKALDAAVVEEILAASR